MEQSLAAVRQVWEVLDERRETVEKTGALSLKGLGSGIRFDGVSFHYSSPDTAERPVLVNINLEVQVNQMVALVGESGGGKSTLTKLVPRFYDPVEGRVLWDGMDLRDIKVADLRRQIAVVTQETILFVSQLRPDTQTFAAA